MRLIALLLLLSAGGFACAPDVRTKTVDRPDTAPLVLPERGWHAHFVMTGEENGSEVSGENDFDCELRQTVEGAALDYSGFIAWVYADGFSFHTKPYHSQHFFYGPLTLHVEGSGDLAGGTIRVEGAADDGGLTWHYDYTITHLSEIGEEDGFAATESALTRLPTTPDEWEELLVGVDGPGGVEL